MITTAHELVRVIFKIIYKKNFIFQNKPHYTGNFYKPFATVSLVLNHKSVSGNEVPKLCLATKNDTLSAVLCYFNEARDSNTLAMKSDLSYRLWNKKKCNLICRFQ